MKVVFKTVCEKVNGKGSANLQLTMLVDFENVQMGNLSVHNISA